MSPWRESDTCSWTKAAASNSIASPNLPLTQLDPPSISPSFPFPEASSALPSKGKYATKSGSSPAIPKGVLISSRVTAKVNVKTFIGIAPVDWFIIKAGGFCSSWLNISTSEGKNQHFGITSSEAFSAWIGLNGSGLRLQISLTDFGIKAMQFLADAPPIVISFHTSTPISTNPTAQ